MKESLSQISDFLSKLSPTLDKMLERLDCKPANTSTLANVTDEDKLDSALSSTHRERLLRAGFLPPHADHIATDAAAVTSKNSKGGVAPESFRRHVSIPSIHSIPSHSSIPMNSVPSNQSTSSYHPLSSLIIIRELSSPRSLKSILI